MFAKAVTRGGVGVQGLRAFLRSFLDWWLGEFRALVPNARFDWIASETKSLLVVTPAAHIVHCQLKLPAAIEQREFRGGAFNENAITNWLGELQVPRDQVSLGLTLDPAIFFQRSLTLPRAALPALSAILEQELLRRTPFDPATVWHAATQHKSAENSKDVVELRHWIVRKDRAELAIRDAQLSAQDIDLLLVTGGQGEQVVTIPLHKSKDAESIWAPRAIQLLAAIAIAMSLFGFILVDWAQSHVASGLEEQLLEARQSIGSAGSNGLVRLLAQKAEPSVIEIWDELSRILPDNTFLTDMRLDDGKVTIAGFSTDAPRLVGLITQSRVFKDANLVGAILPNSAEGKDQFKIAMSVRKDRSVSKTLASIQPLVPRSSNVQKGRF